MVNHKIYLSKNLSSINQFHSSCESAMVYLRATFRDLLEVSNLLRKARTLATSQRDAVPGRASRGEAAKEVRRIRDRVVIVLNDEVNGRYIFSGHMTRTRPFVVSDGGVEYMGDSGEIAFRIGSNEIEVTNIPGSELVSFGLPRLKSAGGILDRTTSLQDIL